MENKIIRLILNTDLKGVIPCFFEKNRKLYYQNFSNIKELVIDLAHPELSDTCGNNHFNFYSVSKSLKSPKLLIPCWDPNGIIIAIRWRPATAWGQPDAEYRMHDVGVKGYTNWENSIKLALFLEQTKWLNAF